MKQNPNKTRQGYQTEIDRIKKIRETEKDPEAMMLMDCALGDLNVLKEMENKAQTFKQNLWLIIVIVVIGIMVASLL